MLDEAKRVYFLELIDQSVLRLKVFCLVVWQQVQLLEEAHESKWHKIASSCCIALIIRVTDKIKEEGKLVDQREWKLPECDRQGKKKNTSIKVSNGH